MAAGSTVRPVAALSNLIRCKIDSAEGVGGLTPAQNGILHFILGRCREQDLFQQDIEEEFNLLIHAVRVLSGLMMFSTMFGMAIMAHSSAECIVGAEALMLPEGYDIMLAGDREGLIKEMRDGGRAGRWQGLLYQTTFHVLTFHGEYRYNFLYWILFNGNPEKGGNL